MKGFNMNNSDQSIMQQQLFKIFFFYNLNSLKNCERDGGVYKGRARKNIFICNNNKENSMEVFNMQILHGKFLKIPDIN